MRVSRLFITTFLVALITFGTGIIAQATSIETASISQNESTKLPAPTNIKTTSNSTSITISWDSVKGAGGYRVWMLNIDTGKYEKYKNVTSTSCTINKLKKNTTYYFKIQTLISVDGTYQSQLKSGMIKATTKNSAQQGWVTKNGAKYYYDNDVMVKSQTKKINGKIYIFGKTGKLLTSGIYTINGNKYYANENGIVTCNKWLARKTVNGLYVYRFATNTGAINEYSFEKTNVVDENGNTIALNLLINGKPATIENFSSLEFWGSFSGIIKLNKDYYRGYIDSTNAFVIANFVESEGTGDPSTSIFDVAKNEKIDYGYSAGLVINSKGCITGGRFYSANDMNYYKFNGESTKMTKISANPIIIVGSSVSVNTASGVNWDLKYINNSNKRIKYATFCVEVINAVDDKVRCTITNKYSFLLKQTGPISAHASSSAYWDAFMYNYSADSIRIVSATIDYMDGTSVSLGANDFTYLL